MDRNGGCAQVADQPMIPQWFWDLLARARSGREALRLALQGLDRQSLEEFIVRYHLASEAVCEPWDGPYIEERGYHLSEDSTEDVTDWIVAQGKDAWEYARGPSVNWSQLLTLSHQPTAHRDPEIAAWHTVHADNTQSGWGAAKSVAMQLYYDRFGEPFCDKQDELLEKYDPLDSRQ